MGATQVNGLIVGAGVMSLASSIDSYLGRTVERTSVMVHRICSNDPLPSPSTAANEVMAEVDDLRQTHKDLIQFFDIILGAGLTAMFLQWDSTAAMYETASQKFTSNPSREIAVAAKAVKAERNRVRDSIMPPSGGFMPA